MSICCGDARDIIEVLPNHPRQADVSGWLLEFNEPLINKAAQSVKNRGLSSSLIPIMADATLAQSNENIPPANVIILAGVLGSVEGDEVPQLLKSLQGLCASSAFIIWTQVTRTDEDKIRAEPTAQKFVEYDFAPIQSTLTPQGHFYVGLNQYTGAAQDNQLEPRLFIFGLRRFANEKAE